MSPGGSMPSSRAQRARRASVIGHRDDGGGVAAPARASSASTTGSPVPPPIATALQRARARSSELPVPADVTMTDGHAVAELAQEALRSPRQARRCGACRPCSPARWRDASCPRRGSRERAWRAARATCATNSRGLLAPEHELAHRVIETGVLAQLGVVEGVGKEADVHDDVGVDGRSVLEAERGRP